MTAKDELQRLQRKAKRDELEDAMAQQLRVAGVAEPTRQHEFHPTRGWLFDFAWPSRLVALEVEGGTWNGGRHVTGGGFERDCEKYGEAAVLGWLVIRVTGSMVKDGRALTLIERVLAAP